MTMSRFWLKLSLWGLLLVAAIGFLLSSPAPEKVQAQQPTGDIPTVTGTPLGAFVTVNQDLDSVNVRSGPSSYFYPRVGVLVTGQSAPALGRSPGGDWIMIGYTGAIRNPFNLLHRLDDIAQDIQNLQLDDSVWDVITKAAHVAGASHELSNKLKRLSCDYCHTANSVGDPNCIACGAPLGKAQPRTCKSCGYVLTSNLDSYIHCW